MARPFLLIQTPRAGEGHHRLLTSPGAGLGELAALALLDAAREALAAGNEALGPTFLAVQGGEVFQAGGDRTGREVLLLGGIDPARLDRRLVLGRLRLCLGRLRELTNRVADAAGGQLLVECVELDGWLDEVLDRAALPRSGLGLAACVAAGVAGLSWLWVPPAVATLATAGAALLFWSAAIHRRFCF